jgi:hypothetical protein
MLTELVQADDLENLSTVWWLHLAGMVEPSRSSADDLR